MLGGLIFFSLLGLVSGQTEPDSFFVGYNSLCNDSSFANANATGIFSFSPGDFNPPEAKWAVSLYQNDTGTQYTWWYSTGGANYTDDMSLLYDVCAIRMVNFTSRAIVDGQNDDGTCSTLLDQDCLDALNNLAENTANNLVAHPTPPPDTNLTSSSLPGVCEDINNAIVNNLPSQCKRFFYTSQANFYALTSETPSNSLMLQHSCPINSENSSGGFTDPNIFWAVTEEYWPIPTNYSLYNLLTYSPTLMLTIFMPVANGNRVGYIETSKSVGTCLRINDIHPGSHAKPPPLVLPKKKLSGGVIAGIVVGVVAGVALLVGLGFWFWRRKRQNAQKQQTKGSDSAQSDKPTRSSESDEERKVSELSPDGAMVELAAAPPKSELPGADNALSELSPQSEKFIRPELPSTLSHELFEMEDPSTLK